jgi:hypothetical protein
MRGGIADHEGIKSKGRPFEKHVRSVTMKALAKNDALGEKVVFPTALKRDKNGEEIDFLARIGKTIIVGEIKCLIAPSDAIDRKNLLDTPNGATNQAARPIKVIRDSRRALARYQNRSLFIEIKRILKIGLTTYSKIQNPFNPTWMQ